MLAGLALAAVSEIDVKLRLAFLVMAVDFALPGNVLILPALALAGSVDPRIAVAAFLAGITYLILMFAPKDDHDISVVPLGLASAVVIGVLLPWASQSPVRYAVPAAILVHATQAVLLWVVHARNETVAMVSVVFYGAVMIRSSLAVVMDSRWDAA